MASNSRQRYSSSGSTRRRKAPSVRLESRSVAQIRRESKRQERDKHVQRVARASRLPLIIIAVIVAVVVIAAIALFALSKTELFKIEEVSIEGTDHLTNQEVGTLVSIPQGTTLLTIDTDSIARSLERDSWVESVDVNRVFPNKLEIVVHEREIGAVVEIPTGKAQTIQNWAIAKDGVWLMVIPSKDSDVGSKLAEQIYEDAEAALHIIGVPYGVEPKIGSLCTDSNINNALEIISGMTTELADQVKMVTATDAESTLLTLDNNVEIAFGSSANIREKERICLELMEQNPKIVYINVRVPDRPTWRAI